LTPASPSPSTSSMAKWWKSNEPSPGAKSARPPSLPRLRPPPLAEGGG
jgi:hypothetical protein